MPPICKDGILASHFFSVSEIQQIAEDRTVPEFLKAIEIILRSAATSLFDVQRWMFDVRRSALNKVPQA